MRGRRGSSRRTPCNQKVLGAPAGSRDGDRRRLPRRGSSCRRVTSTATARTPPPTAGGNHGIQATGDAAGFGKISGMAPRARSRSTRPARDHARHERVAAAASTTARRDRPGGRRRRRRHQLLDLGHDRRTFTNIAEVAFLFAAEAGVFVATSAGNTGPGPRRRSPTRARGSRRLPRARTTAPATAR